MSTTPRTDAIRNVEYTTQGQELLAIYSHAEKLELENIKLLEDARAATLIAKAPSPKLAYLEFYKLDQALKSLEESGVKI